MVAIYYNYTDNGCRNSNRKVFMVYFINVIKNQDTGIKSCPTGKVFFLIGYNYM